MLVQSLSMTGSDLCSASKPWDAQESTAEVIYQEFYEQVRPNIAPLTTPIVQNFETSAFQNNN